MSLRRRRDPEYLTFYTNAESSYPSVSRISGSPAVVWRFHDEENIFDFVGDDPGYIFSNTGEHKVECRIHPKYIKSFAAISASVTRIFNIKQCVALESFDFRNNPRCVVQLTEISKTATSVKNWGTIRGNLVDIPPECEIFSCYGSTAIYGDIVDVPVTMKDLDLYGCASVAGTNISHMPDITNLVLAQQAATQARVNAIILDIWQHRSSFTYAGGITCNLDGNNAAPSGHVIEPEEGSDWHLDGETWIPLTAGAMVFDLVNDVNSEGFNFWNVTVT